MENIRRIAEVGKLFVDTGVITMAAFISPNNELREMASAIIGKADFLEVYIKYALAECERRDVKEACMPRPGKARSRSLPGFRPVRGAGASDLSLDTSVLSVNRNP